MLLMQWVVFKGLFVIFKQIVIEAPDFFSFGVCHKQSLHVNKGLCQLINSVPPR